MSVLVVAEKPSVARAIYPVIGANSSKEGYREGNGYIVSWCVGHLVGLQTIKKHSSKCLKHLWNVKMWTK